MGTTVHISSLDRITERVLDHLRQDHHTALVGCPGCGMTTFVADLASKITGNGYMVNHFDARSQGLAELSRELLAERPAEAGRQVVVLDHVGRLLPDDYRRFLASTADSVARTGDLCLWCGNLDVRSADRQLSVKLCSTPSAHVSFPMLTRDELLAAYAAIGTERGCRWGDAVLYLMLDLCGTDLSLVESATDYLHGDWSDRLYDESVWDRIQEWLTNDETVDAYRTRLNALPSSSTATLALVRFGGKPQCLRAELIEEVDDGLRRLCLDGFIIPNLLPGFYQLRNLVVRFLLDESTQPELLFRRATNERAAALLQDTETMLRQVLASVFVRIGVDAARERLESMPQPGEVIQKELNRSLLDWAKQNCTADAVKGLNELLLHHRAEFKKANSVWVTTLEMMRQDSVPGDGSPHIQCINYLTVDQLGQLVLWLADEVFPHRNDDAVKEQRRKPRFRCASEPKDLIDNWRESVAKMRRLRNQVAHLRNVGFQDMEDLARTLERMRTDVIIYGGWQDRHAVPMEVAEPINNSER